MKIATAEACQLRLEGMRRDTGAWAIQTRLSVPSAREIGFVSGVELLEVWACEEYCEHFCSQQRFPRTCFQPHEARRNRREGLTEVMLVNLCEPRSNWTIEFKYSRAI